MAADWGSYYGPGGASATYVSNMGSPTGWGHGGHGHGRGSLSGQINAFLGDFPDPNASLNALLSYAEQMRQRKRMEAAEAEREAKNAAVRERAWAMQDQPNPNLVKQASEAQLMAQMAAANAMTGGPPLKPAPGLGGGGYVQDELAMSGAQRQAYLPQTAYAGAMPQSGASLGASTSAMPQSSGDSANPTRTAALMTYLTDMANRETDDTRRRILLQAISELRGRG